MGRWFATELKWRTYPPNSRRPESSNCIYEITASIGFLMQSYKAQVRQRFTIFFLIFDMVSVRLPIRRSRRIFFFTFVDLWKPLSLCFERLFSEQPPFPLVLMRRTLKVTCYINVDGDFCYRRLVRPTLKHEQMANSFQLCRLLLCILKKLTKLLCWPLFFSFLSYYFLFVHKLMNIWNFRCLIRNLNTETTNVTDVWAYWPCLCAQKYVLPIP